MAQGYTKGIPISTDGTLSANSDLIIPSQKAVKTYVDVNAGTTTNPIIFDLGAGDPPSTTFDGSVPRTVGYSTVGAQQQNAILSALTTLTYASTSFVKMTGGSTFALDTNTYLTTSSASSTYLTQANAASTYQPLDSDLTSIAALTTTTFGRSLLTQADASATRTTLGLGTLATQNGTITDYLTTASASSTYLTQANAATTYQPLDADLTSWAGVTRASGFDTFTTTPSSANLASLVTDETGTGALVFASSPALAGTPTAPTASAATNNTQIATTAYVTTAVAAKVDSVVFAYNNTSGQTVAASTTTFIGITAGGAGSATESLLQLPMPCAGTLKNFYLRYTNNQSATGSLVITLRKNGVSQAITVTLTSAGGASGTLSDTTNTVTVAAGDLICLQVTNNATATSGRITSASIILERS